MSRDRRRLVLGGAAAAGLAACGSAPIAPAGSSPAVLPPVPPPGWLPPDLTPPPSPREFRAAWVASVANIDWPSRPGLPNATWRAEAIAILDRALVIGLNAIVLQIRPAADALYASAIEPWSEYLTGAQGRAPVPVDDPLALWVEQAHRRGIELHAWFNPYRARHSSARTPLAPSHIALARAHAVKRYGDLDWMDPAEPDAAAQTLAVVTDVVRRYDIDGVHIDDYFYPYPVTDGGVEQPFPDEPAWQRYRQAGGALERADWRRAQVDQLVETLHRSIHAIKPQVRFGISPFGIGKPALRPPGIVGFSQYDKLYADVERWLEQGWLDYLAPQLYWPMDRAGQAFEPLLDYWLAQNPHGRHIWPGLFTSMVGAAAGSGSNRQPWPSSEVLGQIELVRLRGKSGAHGDAKLGASGGASGHVHFSMAALMQDRDGIATWLRAGPYSQPALVPATPWLGGGAPAAPTIKRSGATSLVIVPGAIGPTAVVWSVWRRRDGQWRFEVLPPNAVLAWSARDDVLVVRGVDALGHEGFPALWRPAGLDTLVSPSQRAIGLLSSQHYLQAKSSTNHGD